MKRTGLFLTLALALMTAASASAQFAGVTNGPSTSANCQSAPSLYFDQSTGVVSGCGNLHTLQNLETTLGAFNAQSANTSVTTAQTMASLALPANAQNYVGRVLRLCGYGVYTTPGTTSPTLTLQVTEGGITPVAITSAALSSTASTNMPFQFCFDLSTVSTGSSGTLEAHGQLSINISANTPAAAVATYDDTNSAVSSAINLNSANTLALQVAGSSTISSVTLRQMTIELVN